MLSRFFIDRPVFANVIAWVTVLVGAVCLGQLPVEQYPQVTPPTVRVNTIYPGANAQVVADTVAAPIEQQVNGVENMLYMSSTSSSDGSYSLTVTFDIGTNLDMAQTLVQNRVSIAEPQLPEEVRRQGVTVKKQSTSIIMVVSLTASDGQYDNLFLSNYATLRVRDELSRVAGVGDVIVRGAGAYSMRIWLDPEKLRAYGLTTRDMVAALAEHNVQVAAGSVGQMPIERGQKFQYTVTTLGRLSEPAQFEEIIVKTGENGRSVFLRDVATVELGAQSYDSFAMRTGEEATGLLIFQLPGSNALDVARGVRQAMDKLKPTLPEGMVVSYPFDATTFVDQSIKEVYKTLIEAGVLVLLVILVFLQSWRATLVPATTVPVTLIGTFAIMAALGFSVNLLTLFGLILAIGIVVDDAIVIVENAAHHVERGLPPREATIKAMDEVTGPVIGITLVLMAVFLPASFLPGTTGQLYQQFALTIAATAFLSAVNAVTLKPVQCAAWLRPRPARKPLLTRMFDAVYGPIERLYAAIVCRIVRRPVMVFSLYAGLIGLTGWGYMQLPSGFLPNEDQGYVITSIRLPDAASMERLQAVIAQVNTTLKNDPGVKGWFVLGGYSLLDNVYGSNVSTVFIHLAPWEKRTTPEMSLDGCLTRLNRKLGEIQDASIFAFAPPAIRGLGVAGGFSMQVEDREGVGLEELQRRTQAVMDRAAQFPELGPLSNAFRAGVPQLDVQIDRLKVKRLGLKLGDVFGTLEAHLGSVYVNDFNKFGRTWQVRVQAAAQFRHSPDDIRRLEVRNDQGKMVPLGAVMQVKETIGPQFIIRYNLFPSAAINGAAAPGVSSGVALQRMEEAAAAELPATMGFEWTGMAFEESRVGGEALLVFAMAVLMVYFVLAAQYESKVLPFAVILVVPLGLLGAVVALAIRGMDNNVYTQIGVVLIIALASKNAILIVEFARELRHQGRSITEAAIEAARMRFRPILMTSLAFILGVVPLVWATGAGATGRRSLGTAVFGGMIASTVLAVFVVPVFYVVMQRISELGKRRHAVGARPIPDEPHTTGHGGIPTPVLSKPV